MKTENSIESFIYIFMAKIIARCDVDITPFQPMMLPLLCKLNIDSASLEDSRIP